MLDRLARIWTEPVQILENILCPAVMLVRDTGIEPVTSSVSGKRSPAELIARVQLGGGDGNRTRVHGFAGRCLTTRPLHRWGLMRLHLERMTGFEPATLTLAR